MTLIKEFSFNPFSENTFVLYNDSKDSIIVDPGCFTSVEKRELSEFVKDNSLNVKDVLLTHTHIDHIFGCTYCFEEFGKKPRFHKGENFMYNAAPKIAAGYGIPWNEELPPAGESVSEGDDITIGGLTMNILFVPGHSPAHVMYYFPDEGFIVGGDVLFRESIGRTDLPGGDHDQLINNIGAKVLALPSETVVYCGHGPQTTIAHEKQHNPFL